MAAELLLGLASLLGAADSLVEVTASTSCPAAPAVEERLRVLLPPIPPGERRDRARLEMRDRKVRVSLFDADGTAIVEREIDAQGNCRDLTDAVAIIIAAWQAQRRPELVPTLSLSTPAAPRPPPAAPRAAVVGEVTARVLASAAANDVAPGALLDLGLWGLTGRRLGLRAAFFGATPREMPLGSGTAAWTRLALAVGPALRTQPGPLRLDISASAVAAWVSGRGRDYAESSTASSFSPGFSLGADLSKTVGRAIFALGLSAAAFPIRHNLVVQNSTVRASVPWLEAQANAGVGVMF